MEFEFKKNYCPEDDVYFDFMVRIGHIHEEDAGRVEVICMMLPPPSKQCDSTGRRLDPGKDLYGRKDWVLELLSRLKAKEIFKPEVETKWTELR